MDFLDSVLNDTMSIKQYTKEKKEETVKEEWEDDDDLLLKRFGNK